MKKGKRILSAITLAAIIVLSAVILVLPAGAETEGYYTYTVSNGEATITDVDTAISGEITIPETLGGVTVRNIGESAFADCKNITMLVIPDSVRAIAQKAFFNCYNLTSVTIPGNISDIGDQAFGNCYKLVEVYNLSSINIIKGTTGFGEAGLYALDIYTSLQSTSKLETTSDGYIFYVSGIDLLITYTGLYNDSVTSLTLPEDREGRDYEIYNYAFYKSNLESITLPDAVVGISDYAFAYCRKLTSATFTDNMVSIGNNAFYDCAQLANLIMGNGIESIGEAAFKSCGSLVNIILPESLETIDRYAFEYCTSLENVTMGMYLESIGDSAFAGCNALSSITIPDGVISIGKSAFYNCKITSVTIPASVSSIGKDAFSSFESITVAESNPVYSSQNGILYNKNKTQIIDVPQKIKGAVVIPDTVTAIDTYTFYSCTRITSITIPDSVESIGASAFKWCPNLTTITIPNSVTSIGEDAFSGCEKLVEVYNLSSLSVTKGSTDLGYLGFYAFDIYTSADNTSKIETTSDGYIFYSNGNIVYLLGYVGNGTELVLPNDYNGMMYEIYKYAFYDKTGIASIFIPQGISTIGDYALYEDNGGIAKIFVPKSVTTIGDNALHSSSTIHCDYISTVASYIGEHHFYYIDYCSGGTYSCSAKAICEDCGYEYGDEPNHNFGVHMYDEQYHWEKCQYCEEIAEKAPHYGGTATCTSKARCTICFFAEYGEFADHDFSIQKNDVNQHWHICTICGEQNHSLDESNKCTICGLQLIINKIPEQQTQENIHTAPPTPNSSSGGCGSSLSSTFALVVTLGCVAVVIGKKKKSNK